MTLLEQVARCDHFELGVSALLAVLKIENTETAYGILDPDTWRKMSVEMRLIELASWLRAECFEVIHQIDGATDAYARPERSGVRVVGQAADHNGR